jgi:hypothetical protein
MFAAKTVAWGAPQLRAGDVVRWSHGAVETALTCLVVFGPVET